MNIRALIPFCGLVKFVNFNTGPKNPDGNGRLNFSAMSLEISF